MRRPLGSMMAVLALAATFLSARGPAQRAHADMPPAPDSPDSKRVPATIELDWGVFAERVSLRHVIAAGETLRSIATKTLGNASRVKAIVDANADVVTDPDRIRVGDVLWLPPAKSLEPAAKTPAADTAIPEFAVWYDAFWLESTGYRGRSAPVVSARATPGDAVKGTLLLVPHASATGLIAALADRSKAPVIVEQIAGRLTLGMWTDTLVHREDPTVKIVTTYKLTGATDTSLTTDIARVRYDAEGKVVTKEWVVPQPGYQYEKPSTTPPPAPSPSTPSPTPPPSPTPADPAMATALAVTLSGTAASAATSPPDDGSHWPASTGVIVALVGAAAVAGLWIYRRSRVPTPPPSA